MSGPSTPIQMSNDNYARNTLFAHYEYLKRAYQYKRPNPPSPPQPPQSTTTAATADTANFQDVDDEHSSSLPAAFQWRQWKLITFPKKWHTSRPLTRSQLILLWVLIHSIAFVAVLVRLIPVCVRVSHCGEMNEWPIAAGHKTSIFRLSHVAFSRTQHN